MGSGFQRLYQGEGLVRVSQMGCSRTSEAFGGNLRIDRMDPFGEGLKWFKLSALRQQSGSARPFEVRWIQRSDSG